eukprot:m.625090 g.625090  ORF g.625090 m.625090 type:complete len:1261 (-) comp22547_c0_seq2:1117-4899(-)
MNGFIAIQRSLHRMSHLLILAMSTINSVRGSSIHCSSLLSCGHLSWHFRGGNTEVCGESEVLGVCTKASSLQEAADLCQSMGARLCTSEELLNNVAKGTGCQYDYAKVFSSTPCGDFDGGLVQKGSRKSTLTPVCSSDMAATQTYAVRCCADRSPETAASGTCVWDEADDVLVSSNTITTESTTTSTTTTITTSSTTSEPRTATITTTRRAATTTLTSTKVSTSTNTVTTTTATQTSTVRSTTATITSSWTSTITTSTIISTTELQESTTNSPQHRSAVVYRLNCGGSTVVDGSGDEWVSDAMFTSARYTVTPAKYTVVQYNMPDNFASFRRIFDTERWDADIEYLLPIEEPGEYFIDLYFVENWHPQVGYRKFSVTVQNVTRIESLDIFSEMGFQVPSVISYREVLTSDQHTLSIHLRRNTDSSTGSAIYGLRVTKGAGVDTTTAEFGSVTSSSTAWLASIGMSSSMDPMSFAALTTTPQHTQRSNTTTLRPTTTVSSTTHTDTTTITATSNTNTDTTTITATSNTNTDTTTITATSNTNTDTTKITATSNTQTATTLSTTATETSTQAAAQHTEQSISAADPVGEVMTEIIYRINCGGDAVIDGNGFLWQSDAEFTTARYKVRPAQYISVLHTLSPNVVALGHVLETERYDAEFTFRVPVIRGHEYRVELLFVENWHRAVGSRVFSVAIETATVLSNYDIVQDVGFQVPVIHTFHVFVTDTELTIHFAKHEESPEGPAIYGLRIGLVTPKTSTPAPTTHTHTSVASSADSVTHSTDVAIDATVHATVVTPPAPTTPAPTTLAPTTPAPSAHAASTARPSPADTQPHTGAPAHTMPMSYSMETCESLEWTVSDHGDVCAASSINGQCFRKASAQEAARECQSVGARLCSANELADDVAKGTGCMFDYDLVISSTPCNGSYLAVPGSSKSSTSPVCLAPVGAHASALVAVRCCADTEASAQRPPYMAGFHDIDIPIGTGGESRKFKLYIPPVTTTTSEGTTPVLLSLHGVSTNPVFHIAYTGVQPHLDNLGWVGVFPYGTAEEPTDTCCGDRGCLETDQDNPCSFNAGRCCGIAASRRTDDISVLRAIIDWCHSTLNTDRKAFLSGFSNGGMLANRAACEMSDRVRAVAPVGAALEYSIEFPACTPETPVPYVGLCGAADSYCNFFREASETWAIQNGCNYRSSHVSYATATTTCRTFDGCTAATEWCMVENLGHRWPGHALPSRSRVQNANNIDATFHIMQRFAAMVDVQYDTDLPADA